MRLGLRRLHAAPALLLAPRFQQFCWGLTWCVPPPPVCPPACAQLVDRLTAMGSEGSPAGAKAAVKALVGLLGRERAAAPAAALADKLVKALKVSQCSASQPASQPILLVHALFMRHCLLATMPP